MKQSVFYEYGQCKYDWNLLNPIVNEILLNNSFVYQ